MSPGSFPKKFSFGKKEITIPAMIIIAPNIIKYLPIDCIFLLPKLRRAEIS